MSDDNFDFDDLPDWLQGDNDLPDEPSEDIEQSEWETTSTDQSAAEDGSSLGVTGALPWRQDTPDTDSDAGSEQTLPDWLSGADEFATSEPSQVDDTVGWDDESSDSLLADEDDFVAWMTADGEPDDASAAEDLDALLLGTDDEPAFEDESSAPIPSEPPVIRRIEPIAPPPEPETPKPPTIRRLGEARKEEPERELTFEEWERQQQQEEFEEEHAEELALEAEVPDWFVDNVEMGDAANELASILVPDMEQAPTPPIAETDTPDVSGDYVPEWFMGLEEQNLEDAPEWVKEATTSKHDLSSLADTSDLGGAKTKDDAPEEFPEPDFDDIPDWFTGAGETMRGEEQQWMAAFDTPEADGTETELQEPSSLSLDESAFFEDTEAQAELREEAGFPAPDIHNSDALFQDEGAGELEEIDLFAEDASLLPDALSEEAIKEPELAADASPSWLQDYETPEESDELPGDDFLAEEDEPSIDLGWLDEVADADFSTAPPETETPRGQAVEETDQDILDLFGEDTGIEDLLASFEEPSTMIAGDASPLRDDMTAMTDLFDGVDEALFEEIEVSEPEVPLEMLTLEEPVAFEAPAAPVIIIEDEDEEEAEPAIHLAEGPEWVEELRPDMPVTLGAGGFNLEFEQQGVANLPDDLRELHEAATSLVQSQSAVDDVVIDSGTLAGVTGGLPIHEAATRIGDPEIITHIRMPPAQAARVEQLATALDIEDEDIGDLDAKIEAAIGPAEQPERQRRRVKRRLDRVIIAIVLLAALIGPFFTDALHFADKPSEQLAIEQQTVVSSVAALQPGDRVLVAFEYGPTTAGELNALAEAVLRDILRQRAIPIIFSTNPLGVLNARYVLDNLARDEALLNVLERDDRLQTGKDYFTLRYISGGAIAIRALSRSEVLGTLLFSTDSTGEQTDLEIGRVDAEDFALVLVIGETIDNVRDWAEQFDIPTLLKFALVTSATEPLAQAYVDPLGNLAFAGYLAGYRDTYRYNHLRNQGIIDDYEVPDDLDAPDPDISQLHSSTLGILVVSTLMLIGLLFNTLRGLRRRRR